MKKFNIIIVALMVFFFACLVFEVATNDWGYNPTKEPYDIFNSTYPRNDTEEQLGEWEIEIIKDDD